MLLQFKTLEGEPGTNKLGSSLVDLCTERICCAWRQIPRILLLGCVLDR